jgi:hypothetical protein
LGGYISEFSTLKKCIEQGIEGENGYDVGVCSGEFVSLILDTKL